jgi:hypothetical protein
MVPELCINFSQPVSVSLNGESVEISASLKWLTDSSKAEIQFVASGWTIEIMGSDSRDGKVTLEASGETQKDKLTLKLTPQNGVEKGTLKAISSSGNQLLAFQEIAYSHIPTQVYMPSAEVALTNLNVQKTGVKVGYITRAGDGVANAIAQMGYEVTMISESNINGINWSDFQAVVVGIRAYNTQEWLVGYSQQIFDYIQQGGNYIVQYNTASRFLEDKALIPAPFPFDLSNGRVTEEDSPVTFELPEHPVLNRPNKITQADFDHWVQERGLYFAKTWDAAYATPISWHDTGLQPELGGLIIADFGEGAFMYTGISFFRELPAGVPGAYRLLANLISYEKE